MIKFFKYFVIFLYAFLIITIGVLFCSKYFLNYDKEVILGGTGIGLYPSTSTSGVSYTNTYFTSGTLTYIDNGRFGALGHSNGISKGQMVKTNVSHSVKNSDRVGHVISYITSETIIADFDTNTSIGVFGNYYDTSLKETIKVGMPNEIKKGIAYIKTTVLNNESRYYKIDIYFIEYINNTSNIFFKVIDEDLLSATGGVIKGMSGSPIIQNNKLIGAVNSVNLNDYTKGHGVFITSMLSKSDYN